VPIPRLFRPAGARGRLAQASGGTHPGGEATTFGNMRENGARSLAVSCWICHHQAVLSTDRWPDHVPVPSFGPRMVPGWAAGSVARVPAAKVEAIIVGAVRQASSKLLSMVGCRAELVSSAFSMHRSHGRVSIRCWGSRTDELPKSS
jgi:hypothetical protein